MCYFVFLAASSPKLLSCEFQMSPTPPRPRLRPDPQVFSIAIIRFVHLLALQVSDFMKSQSFAAKTCVGLRILLRSHLPLIISKEDNNYVRNVEKPIEKNNKYTELQSYFFFHFFFKKTKF